MANPRRERRINERVCIRTVGTYHRGRKKPPTVYAVIVDGQWRNSFLTVRRAREFVKTYRPAPKELV